MPDTQESQYPKFREPEKGDTENSKHILLPLHNFTLVAFSPRAEFLRLYYVSVPLRGSKMGFDAEKGMG